MMKKSGVYLMALFYVAAGIMHFVRPGVYLNIMPDYLPLHRELVFLSGVMELLAGLLLLFPSTRIAGAWLTIVTLIVVFPANIQMAVDFYREKNPGLWIALLRLPAQPLLIWWAWLFTRPEKR